jgi:DNA polymerase-3 subunit epsilon
VIWPFARRRHVSLDAASAARRDALAALAAPDLDQPLAALRWCVVDVETGGLDALHDPLLAIGAVMIEEKRIALAHSFETGLTQAQATGAANILIHGITDSAQRAGQAAHVALLDWLEFAGNVPRVAFHAGFDQTVLERDTRRQLGLRPPAPWFDAALVAPLLFPAVAPRYRHLDDWLGHFGIAVYTRHGALADAYATAELWLVLLDAAARERVTTARQLLRLLRARRWLSLH